MTEKDRDKNLQVLNMLGSTEFSTFFLLIATTAFAAVFFGVPIRLAVFMGTIPASLYLGLVTYKLKKLLESEEK